MTQAQLKSLVKLCRELGVIELEFEGIKVKLSAEVKKPIKVLKKKDLTPEEDSEPQYTDEEILFWSSQDGGAFKEQVS